MTNIFIYIHSRISISRILDKSNSRCLEQNNRSHPYQFTQNDHSISRTLYIYIQSTLDISNCQGTNKFVPDIESSTYRVVILCKLIKMGPIGFDLITETHINHFVSFINNFTQKYGTFYEINSERSSSVLCYHSRS